MARSRLFSGGLLLAAWLAAASVARAVTFTVTLPMPAFTTGTTMTTSSNPTLGTFDFTSTPFTTFTNLNSVSLTLALYDLQTMPSGTGQQKLDFNNLSLTFGGVSSGLLLNGYDRNVGSTVTTAGAPTNGAAILAALTSGGGLLTFGILDATTNPANQFDYFGGTASLTFDVTLVPFNPSSSLGFGLIAALAFWRNRARLKFRFNVGKN